MRLLFLPLCFFYFFAASQSPVEFARLGVNEGLSQNSVYAIHQDEQGFLWIGTGDGLNRYDGKSFKIFREKWGDTSSRNLPGRMITSSIIQDKEQRLWFCTNTGIVVMDKKKERFMKPSVQNTSIKQWEGKVKLLGVDAWDNLWFCSSSNEFILLDIHTWHTKKPFVNVSLKIEHALVDTNKVYFTTKNGFYVYNIAARSTSQVFKEDSINYIHRIAPNKISFGSSKAIYIYNTLRGSVESFKPTADKIVTSFAELPILFCEYPANVYYLKSQGKGFRRNNRQTGEQSIYAHEPGNPSSLSNNYITTTYIDRSNNLWIGTEGGGLSRMDLKPQKFKSFPSYTVNARQAANLMVKSIFKIGGKILIGTFSQGLYVVDPLTGNFQQLSFPLVSKHREPQAINVFYQDKSKRLWMNIGNAIGYLDTVSFKFKEVAFLKAVDNRSDHFAWVYSLVEYAPDHFLLGTYYGLYRMQVVNGKIETTYVASDSILNGHIQALQMAPDGSIYVGKLRNGFWRIKFDGKGIAIMDNGFLTTGIRHFYFDKKMPVVWMASESGLIAYNSITKKSTVFDRENGLSNGYIYSILPENDSTIWLSTNKGINRATIRYDDDDIKKNISFNAYTQVDGLQSNEFNTGAFFRSGDGELYFGGVNGINWFNGSRIITNHHQPSVVLTSFLVNEKEYESETAVPYLKNIELRHDQNTINLRFASLEYTNAKGNLYAYQLEGIDKDWIYSNTANEARYVNLPPGEYLFKMRGTNSDGVWNVTPQSISINILPPYWQTTWFRLIAVFVALTTLVILTRYYIATKVRNKVKELEKQKAVNEERLRISRDMHDELGTGLTKIALLGEVTKQRFQKYATDFSPLQEITTTSRQLTQKMGEIIWTLNPMNDTLDNLAAYLKEHLYELSETASLDLTTTFPNNIPPLKVSNRQRQQILLVTKEGFNNIIKHANAAHVWFSMEIGKEITFTLEDDGVGFKQVPMIDSTNGKRNGLNNMAWRMEQVEGSLLINNRREGGTVLKYRIPLLQ